MGKQSDSESEGSSSSTVGTPREPPELVDPITLTLMEEAVMVTCGHSFSKASITAWLRQQQQGSAKVCCPVCKSPISESSILPNWALRNAVDRYCEKHGIKQNSGAGASAGHPGGAVSHAAGPSAPTTDEEHPMKPSASGAFDFDASADTPAPPPTTSTSTSSSYQTQHTSITSPGAEHHHTQDDGDGCCDLERPHGKHSCCVWECKECGVCKMADDCNPGCAVFFPTTTLLCVVSFGQWSNWWSRTLCGSVYPVFVALVCFLLIADLVIICVFWTAWSLYIPLGILFFVMTHYFCPVVNRTVSSVCGDFGSFIFGNFYSL